MLTSVYMLLTQRNKLHLWRPEGKARNKMEGERTTGNAKISGFLELQKEEAP